MTERYVELHAASAFSFLQGSQYGFLIGCQRRFLHRSLRIDFRANPPEVEYAPLEAGAKRPEAAIRRDSDAFQQLLNLNLDPWPGNYACVFI